MIQGITRFIGSFCDDLRCLERNIERNRERWDGKDMPIPVIEEHNEKLLRLYHLKRIKMWFDSAEKRDD